MGALPSMEMPRLAALLLACLIVALSLPVFRRLPLIRRLPWWFEVLLWTLLVASCLAVLEKLPPSARAATQALAWMALNVVAESMQSLAITSHDWAITHPAEISVAGVGVLALAIVVLGRRQRRRRRPQPIFGEWWMVTGPQLGAIAGGSTPQEQLPVPLRERPLAGAKPNRRTTARRRKRPAAVKKVLEEVAEVQDKQRLVVTDNERKLRNLERKVALALAKKRRGSGRSKPSRTAKRPPTAAA